MLYAAKRIVTVAALGMAAFCYAQEQPVAVDTSSARLDKPVMEQTPAAQDKPAGEQAATVQNRPVAEQAPTGSTSAAVQDKPDQEQTPAVQDKPAGEQAATDDKEQTKLFLDNIEVLGQLEKPQAVFFIPGTNPEIDDIQIKRSFFELIFRPVEKKGLITPSLPVEPKKENKDVIPW